MYQLAVLTNLAFIDGIGFDPFFRGLSSVIALFLVLVGSTYMIVATNTGVRSGFLLSAAALFGWLFLMGAVWTVYGIGWKGQSPTWNLVEINVDDVEDADDGLAFSEVDDAVGLATSSDGGVLPDGGLGQAVFDSDQVMGRLGPDADADRASDLLSAADSVIEIADQDLSQSAALVASRDLDLGGWRYLVTSDGVRGEAQASADAFLVEEGVFEVGGFLPEQFGAFIIDGKPVLKEDANMFDRVVQTLDETLLHPTFADEFIVVQVRETIDQPTLPGQAPPTATADTDAPLVSVVMLRDRGGPIPALFSGLRFTSAMFTVFTGLIFALLAWNLHVRDLRETQIRAAA